jgi:hypothetical protein
MGLDSSTGGRWRPKVGDLMAVVRLSDGAVLATAKVDKVNDKEIRTETPYEQRAHDRELSRRYWRATAPYEEMRIQRKEKAIRPRCFIRPVTVDDDAVVERRVAARRAREQMPLMLRYKAAHEDRIQHAKDALQRAQEPYDRLLEQILEAEAAIEGDPGR